jgi:hypothetical protein
MIQAVRHRKICKQPPGLQSLRRRQGWDQGTPGLALLFRSSTSVNNIYLFFISLPQIAALLEMDLNKFGRDTVLGSNTTFRVSETPFWVRLVNPPCELIWLVRRCGWAGYQPHRTWNSSLQGSLIVSLRC